MFEQFKKTAYKTLYIQIVIVFIAASISFIIDKNVKNSFSIIMGGVAWILPSLYFICKIFKVKKAVKTSLNIIKDFYIGEVMKLFISALLIVVVVKFVPINIKGFLLGYIVTVLCAWLFPLLLIKKMRNTDGNT